MARRNNSCSIAINHNNDWGPHPMRPGRPGQRGTRRSVGNRNSAPPRQERSPPFATGIEWARPRPAVGGAATKKLGRAPPCAAGGVGDALGLVTLSTRNLPQCNRPMIPINRTMIRGPEPSHDQPARQLFAPFTPLFEPPRPPRPADRPISRPTNGTNIAREKCK